MVKCNDRERILYAWWGWRMIEEARIEYDEKGTTLKKVIVDNVEILDVSLGLYDNVFVRVRDIDGYEYAGELTGIMDDWLEFL